jgi:hypothetical protein
VVVRRAVELDRRDVVVAHPHRQAVLHTSPSNSRIVSAMSGIRRS